LAKIKAEIASSSTAQLLTEEIEKESGYRDDIGDNDKSEDSGKRKSSRTLFGHLSDPSSHHELFLGLTCLEWYRAVQNHLEVKIKSRHLLSDTVYNRELWILRDACFPYILEWDETLSKTDKVHYSFITEWPEPWTPDRPGKIAGEFIIQELNLLI
jgi:hypothetical protein